MWRAAYSLVLYGLVPLIGLRLLWRARRNPDYLRRWGERFRAGPELPPRPRIWIHAVSVGEVAAAVPLVGALRRRFPGYAVLVTTTTPTGSAEVRRRLDEDVEHRYLPLDLPHLMRAFVRAVQPRLLMVMETELWPNLYAACRARGVPVMLVNGRLSERSLRGYRWVRPLVARTLRDVSALAARSEADARRFRALGADAARVRVPGNVKYDLPTPSAARVTGGRDAAGRRPVWIAASTHDGEDEQVLEAHRSVRAQVPGALLVLVPRHPERFGQVGRLCEEAGFSVVRRSRGEVPDARADVWLGDTMGELPALFVGADVAFMGGSLVPTGGHNPLEAAVHGVPVLTGPHVFNFREVFDVLVEAGGAQVITGPADLADALVVLLTDAEERERRGVAAARMVTGNRGAVGRVIDWAGEILAEDRRA